MAYNLFYGQLREGAERIFNKGYEDMTGQGKDPAGWILKTLRKYGALDVLGEFYKKGRKPQREAGANRHYVAGYYDALADLTRYIQREMDNENE
ncbi:hypothetical protein PP460_gp076 [Streptomyces phage Muntaha]|uniref:Uncharacterized protein n=1 Tax=Streptomyces phage Muntaha TaxID=2713269 RepID=A0A6G8R3H9_9CAUD|nr:hypothetical protein PP460_gp076 [Streptomyces phage Muntaha]QIN94726.1 hypothetical protein SEA_MUNTAHA_202 [Streptomyces phage Muntaha]